jgi:hypothetical protein
MLIFEIEGIPKSEILEGLGFTVEGEYVITDEGKIPVEDVEMVVNKNGKLTLLTDPIDISDFFVDIEDERGENENP